MTWNVHGGNSEQTLYPLGVNNSGVNNNCNVIPTNVKAITRRIAVYSWTHAHMIDAIALQEVHRGQAEEIAHDLGYQRPHFVSTKVCDGRNHQLDYGNAILSPHQMKDLIDYPVNHIADSESSFHEYNRIAAASVRLPSGRWVRVFSSHLTANPEGDEAAHQSLLNKQVSEALFIVNVDEFFVSHGVRSVFMVDFNTTESAPNAYDHMVNPAMGGLFDDAWRKVYPAGTGRTTPALTPHLRFDHIFFDRRSDLRITGAEVLDICGGGAGGLSKTTDCLSDHRPVVATVRF